LADGVTEEHQGSRRFLRGWLVVQRLNAEVIRQAIEDLCRRSTGESWPEVRKRLDRYLLPDDEDLTSWSA
jgi:hypothetical protein